MGSSSGEFSLFLQIVLRRYAILERHPSNDGLSLLAPRILRQYFSINLHASPEKVGRDTKFLERVVWYRTVANVYPTKSVVRTTLHKAGKNVVISPKRCRKQPRDYDKHLYRARHLIEQFFNKLKQYRSITTRYDKTACTFLGASHLAAAVV